jgi:hypothetical protein
MTRAPAAGAIIEAVMGTPAPFPAPAGNQDDHPAVIFSWTWDEHARFVDALEQLYCGNESIQDAWSSIAAAVQTRSIAEVKQHALEYLSRLQTLEDWPTGLQASVSAIAEPDTMMGTHWTREENALLEDLLAVYSLPTVSATYCPWALIAQRIPNKTQQDVREQYELLCQDIERMDQSDLWPTGQLSQSPPAHLGMEIQPSPTSIFSQCFSSPIETLSPFPSEPAFERPRIRDRPQSNSRGQHAMTCNPLTAGFSMRNALLISALPTPKGGAVSPVDNEPAF